jgi:segregation and condensation protein A
MELLIASLEERQKQESFQRIQLGLSMMEALYQGASNYLETPRKLPEDGPRELLSQNPQDLFSAMERLVLRQHESLPPSVTSFHGLVGQEPYPVEQKAAELYCLISMGGRFSLQELIWDCRSRSELVAMFLAVLELCRSGQILMTSHEQDVTLSLPQCETAALIAT